MTGAALITLENVGCRYRSRQKMVRFKTYEALRDVSLTLYRGEALGIIGRNGAGKSTLLKLIAGILRPDSGKIIKHGSPAIALLTMQLGFANELSGRHNAIMGAMLLGYTKAEALARLDRIIAFAELEKWIDEPLKTYSSGMRARLGFAVAMEMSPDVLLVDEVLGVGDVAFRDKSMQAMREKFQADQTIVFVSHAAATVKQLCNRAVWIEDGVTRLEGDAAEVVDAYEWYVKEGQKKL
jgi:lipopolysaccharide transport system ATP-binding protein